MDKRIEMGNVTLTPVPRGYVLTIHEQSSGVPVEYPSAMTADALLELYAVLRVLVEDGAPDMLSHGP